MKTFLTTACLLLALTACNNNNKTNEKESNKKLESKASFTLKSEKKLESKPPFELWDGLDCKILSLLYAVEGID